MKRARALDGAMAFVWNKGKGSFFQRLRSRIALLFRDLNSLPMEKAYPAGYK
jgi:hypothetical protein